MNVQLNLFGNTGDRPCQYRFERYIGQKVTVMIGAYPGKKLKGRITGIDAYYTQVRTKEGDMVATPYSLSEQKEG